MDEFLLIEKYFRPLAQKRKETLNFEDDAAILNVPKGYELVVSSDILAAGTHFLPNEKPEYIAHRALRTNLSDLAAMGAKPYAYQMCIVFDKKPTEKWIKAFTSALRADQKEFGIFCLGGDTTMAKDKLTISISAFGLAPKGKAVKRSGAKPGDALLITGTIGNAHIGLNILQGKLKTKSVSSVHAHRKPVPRVAIADIIRAHANAAIDISDGLIAEVNHICRASRCAADLHLENLEFSPAAQKLLKSGAVTINDLITGGDDYELVLAVPPRKLPALLKSLESKGLKPQIIGRFTKGSPSVRVLQRGRKIALKKSGFTHF